ncbi:hypothetical protein Tco_0960497 [Tanacetum coccineum]
MTKRYEISMMGVLTYFLGFQIKQSERGISINKEKDVNDLLRMYDKIDSSVNTPIMPPNMLGPDLNGNAVNECQNRDIAAAGYYAIILWIVNSLTIIYDKLPITIQFCTQKKGTSMSDQESYS